MDNRHPDRGLPSHPSGVSLFYPDNPRAVKVYDQGFVAEIRRMWRRTPLVSMARHYGRTTRHEGYAKSIKVRQEIAKVFSWI